MYIPGSVFLFQLSLLRQHPRGFLSHVHPLPGRLPQDGAARLLLRHLVSLFQRPVKHLRRCTSVWGMSNVVRGREGAFSFGWINNSSSLTPDSFRNGGSFEQ